MQDDDELPSPDEINGICEPPSVHETRQEYGMAPKHGPKGFKDLRVWQVGMDLAAESYCLTKSLPKDEQFGLVPQIRRAACSVTLNISEGWGRNSKRELARSADIARGSVHEVDGALELCVRLEYLARGEIEAAESLINRVGVMLFKLAAALRK